MFKRILIPLDGSERAEQALPVAARIARGSGGSVILLQVIDVSGHSLLSNERDEALCSVALPQVKALRHPVADLFKGACSDVLPTLAPLRSEVSGGGQ